jgi:hypothetical protein
MGPNKYVGMRNYLLTGLYRNGHIGDPNLLFPDGSHVYGTDGTPGVAYVDGFIAGKTKESVLPPAPEPVADGNSTPPPASGSSAPSATPEPKTNGVPVNVADAFPQGGCSSTGFQSAWLALPLFGLFALRRRRAAA